MPVSYMILDATILAVLTGEVQNRELLEGQHALFEDPAFVGTYPRLVDCTGVTKWNISSGIVQHVARCAIERGLTKAALVSNDTHVVYGMLRMYSEVAGSANVEVFRDRESAFQWLNGTLWKIG